MKTRIWKYTWPADTYSPSPFSLWVVRGGPKHRETTRYFTAWTDAMEYVTSGEFTTLLRRIELGL